MDASEWKTSFVYFYQPQGWSTCAAGPGGTEGLFGNLSSCATSLKPLGLKIFQKDFKKISKKFKKKSKKIQKNFLKKFKKISKNFQKIFKNFQKKSKEFLKKF